MIFGLRLLCPIVTVMLAGHVGAAAQQQAPPVSAGGVGYPSVSVALEALQHKNGVKIIKRPDGWTVIEDGSSSTLWSFAPQNYPAYPAVVRRQIIQKGGDIHVAMSVLCEAPKLPCDKLVAEFEELNNKIRQTIRRGPAQ